MEKIQKQFCLIKNSSESSDNSREENIYNYGEIVDNLKHFTVASQSRFVSLNLDKKDEKTSYSSIETSDTIHTSYSNTQQLYHKSSNDYLYYKSIPFHQDINNNNRTNISIYCTSINTSKIPKKMSFEQNNYVLNSDTTYNHNLFNKNHFNTNQCFYQQTNTINYPNNINTSPSHFYNNINSNQPSLIQTNYKKSKHYQMKSFDTLEALQQYLKGRKQIGNYIKCRKNTEIVIDLLRRLPKNKIDELIELINPKMKDIIISNNKFVQELFELTTKEQRLRIINIIENNFILIISNKWGSFSFHYLLNSSSSEEEQHAILAIMQDKLIEIINNKRANYFLQKLIPNLSHSSINKLYQIILKDNITQYISNSLTLGFLQTFLSYFKDNILKFKLLQQLFTYKNICLILDIITIYNPSKKGDNNMNLNENNNLFQTEMQFSNILGIDFIINIITLLQTEKANSLSLMILDLIVKEVLIHIESLIISNNQNGHIILIKILSFANKDQLKYIPSSFVVSKYLIYLNRTELGKQLFFYLSRLDIENLNI